MATQDPPTAIRARRIDDPRTDNANRFQPEYVTGDGTRDHDHDHWNAALERFDNRRQTPLATDLAGRRMSRDTEADDKADSDA